MYAQYVENVLKNLRENYIVLKNVDLNQKNYPEKEDLLQKLHDFSGNYREVAEFFKLTRKIITNLVKRYSLKEEVDKIRKTNRNKKDN